MVHQYDIVVGPVADDNLYQVLVNYENGVYDMLHTQGDGWLMNDINDFLF